MLKHSTRLMLSHQRLFHASGALYKIQLHNVNLQNKVLEIKDVAISRYNQIIGYEEIEIAYQQITKLQEDLEKIQNERTGIQMELTNTSSDLTNVQTEVHEHTRGTPRYLELMKREFDILQEKQKLEALYQIIDRNERECFSHLQSRINILHDKSRTHTRQWGIISTVIGASLGIIGTSVSAYWRKNHTEDLQQQFQLQIEQISKDTQQLISEGFQKLIDHYEALHKVQSLPEQQKKPITQNNESWAGYFRRKTIAVWRFCTFQKST